MEHLMKNYHTMQIVYLKIIQATWKALLDISQLPIQSCNWYWSSIFLNTFIQTFNILSVYIMFLFNMNEEIMSTPPLLS